MTNAQVIYIAGPMSSIKDFNFPAFFEADDKLKSEGLHPINPAKHDLAEGTVVKRGDEYVMTDDFDLVETLLWDLQQVGYADAIYLLEGWENSKGARAEHALAVALSKEIIFQPKTPPLVGIGGLLASGKDTVADYLVEHFGYTKLNMSAPLHEAMLALNPVLHEDHHGTPWRYSDEWENAGHDYATLKENNEVRRLLQIFGTDIGRVVGGENVWVDIAGRKIDELRAEGKPVVITGIRYPNELEMIRGRKGHALWVDRGQKASGHQSETSVSGPDFDITVENLTDLDYLYESTEALAKEFAA